MIWRGRRLVCRSIQLRPTSPAPSTQKAGSAQSSPNFQANNPKTRARKQLKNQRFHADISTTAATFASQCEPTEHRNQISEAKAQAAVSARRTRGNDRCATRHAIDYHGEERTEEKAVRGRNSNRHDVVQATPRGGGQHGRLVRCSIRTRCWSHCCRRRSRPGPATCTSRSVARRQCVATACSIPFEGVGVLTPQDTERIVVLSVGGLPAQRARRGTAGRLLLRYRRPRPLPCQRLQATQHLRARLARRAVPRSLARRARRPGGVRLTC